MSLFQKKKKNHISKLSFIEKCDVYNIFIKSSQEILSDKLLQIVMGHLSGGYKLKSITTYHIKFAVKILWTYRFSTSL